MVDQTYKPNDLTLAPFPGGYLIGRICDPNVEADGAHWKYVKATSTNFNRAIREARELAKARGVTAWVLEPDPDPAGRFVWQAIPARADSEEAE
jgi:hypothetical protein